jgi:hypothetical protein
VPTSGRVIVPERLPPGPPEAPVAAPFVRGGLVTPSVAPGSVKVTVGAVTVLISSKVAAPPVPPVTLLR